jgi:hypothetical protein
MQHVANDRGNEKNFCLRSCREQEIRPVLETNKIPIKINGSTAIMLIL